MSTPKISIIVPVYNMANYLNDTISCLVMQSMPEIEILCVDDASTDGSADILQQWAEKDSRMIVHYFSENKTAWAARKWAIEHASGEYILFVDADDTLEQKACEELYKEMRRKPVDILHFNANIINVNNVPESRIDSMRKFVCPYNGVLQREEIFIACFREKRYQFSLWNKLFSSKVCKEAINGTRDMFLPKAQDKLLYWMISLNAKSYRGIPRKTYYNYYFGRGGTGFNRLNLMQFERYCTMADTADAMRRYLVDCGLYEKFRDIDDSNRYALLNDCMTRFQNEVCDSDKSTAFDLMLKKWNGYEVVSSLASYNWYARYKLANDLKKSETLKCSLKTPKVIAAYYHSCANGGAQRVMCELCSLWASMGYEIVAFTDEPPTENDYPLPEKITRIVLPNYKEVNKTNYIERARILDEALKEYHVDIMVYHAWVSPIMLWDELICKINSIAFIGHCHNIFSFPLMKNFANMYSIIAPYILADAVVTLSRTDRYFWQYFNVNVHDTINPFTDSITDWLPTKKLDEKQILWVGRMASEKRPYDTLHIMRRVLEKVPDAHLHIVGDNPNPSYMDNFRAKIISMGLSDHVTVHGFQLDVRSFYENASIFLMTSEYEGFSLTLQESKLAGLPCVMYSLPYLTLCENNRGILPVEMNSIKDAAEAIVDLLTDDEKRHRYAKDARAHIEDLSGFDFAAKWSDIFSSIGMDHTDILPDEAKIMLDTILRHHEVGISNAKKAVNVITGSGLPKIIRGGIQCCADHGVGYTIKYAFKKLFRKLFGK